MVKADITTVLAIASFILSIFTLWMTQFQRGRLGMTQPTLICLKREMPSARPKIFLRTLLFATATKGRVIENMFLRVHQPMGTFIFDFWGHTEAGKLTLGSGLFVGQAGVACDHHFNPRHGAENFLFHDGDYRVEIFATTVRRKRAEKLMEVSFTIDSQQAAELVQILDRELLLFWDADTRAYEGQVEQPPHRPHHDTNIPK
jgi:hypothetical protein